jgi:hypothetical protein
MQIDFGLDYQWFTDTAGAGSAASRVWLDCPDQGEVVIGPRSGSIWLEQIRLRADNVQFDGLTSITTGATGYLTYDGSSYAKKQTRENARIDLLKPMMASGSGTSHATAGTVKSFVFGKTLAGVPNVTVSRNSTVTTACVFAVYNVSATGFDLYCSVSSAGFFYTAIVNLA